MPEKQLLCLGYGYVARRLARTLTRDGWRIAGTYRNSETRAQIEAEGLRPISWAAGRLDRDAFERATAILVSTPPGDDGCPALKAVGDGVEQGAAAISWIGYLSSNGVYGDHKGAWVDETSPLLATSRRARNRIDAEKNWRAFGKAAGIPVIIFRLPGIYGPGRSAFDAIREGRAQRIDKPGQVFSRAHVDDIAAALKRSLDAPDAGDLFNIADDEPAPPQDVVSYACDLLGVATPPLIPFEEAALSEMAKSFYADNKRVSNALMKARLLPSLNYPTYREGLAAILSEERVSERLPG